MNTYPGRQGTRAQIEQAAHRAALRGSGLDVLLAVFWFTAGLAAVVSYNAAAALAKFWTITISIGVYYAIAGLGGKHTRLIVYSLAGLGAAISIRFILLHDWLAQPADFSAISRLGEQIMAIRPILPVVETAPNQVGGVLAAMVPLAVVAVLIRPRNGSINHRERTHNWWTQAGPVHRSAPTILSAVALAIMVFGLVMTSSRAAWFALLAGGGAWLLSRVEAWWSAADNGWYLRHRRKIRAAFVAALSVLVLLSFTLFDVLVLNLDRYLPGAASGQSRERILLNSLRLVQVFQVIGGGLGSFPGLYSEYMLVTPYYSFGYAHNMYADVSIEQGVLAVGALLVVMALSLGWSLDAAERGVRRTSGRLAQAAFAGLVVMLVHGITDDAFYGEAGTPLLFLLPALAVHVIRVAPGDEIITPKPALSHSSRFWYSAGAVMVLLMMVLVSGGFRGAVSGWLANVGAVEMAQVQLADFPAGEWIDGSESGRLEKAESWLQQAWAFDPENRSANQRLGLMRMQRGSFEDAAYYLERAYSADPGHVGVVKNLGYTYVWLGRFEDALPLLRTIPEARSEMEAYAVWWQRRGRPELAARAAEMADLLR